ncbi:MAG: site-2 protease family protein [Myxococcota bacterium]|nr:site-2 protease family protein [Myxococcota bacterium]
MAERRKPIINIALFFATLVTTWFAGLMGATFEEALKNGAMYMGSIMAILLSHEMGHYVMARRNNVPASLPYFLPVPIGPIGTFGAVIVMRGRIRSRNALMEIGAAGPLAGVVVAIPILLYGLAHSPLMPLPEPGTLTPDTPIMLEGQSLLYMGLKRIAVGSIPTGYDVNLHPMAWAGWVGLLVTMLNLFPIGQLDGGHILYALSSDAHPRISKIFFLSLFFIGASVSVYGLYTGLQLELEQEALFSRVFTGSPWVFMGLLMLFFFGRNKGRGFVHPPVDDPSLSPIHRRIGIACLILFAVTFMPIPLQILV